MKHKMNKLEFGFHIWIKWPKGLFRTLGKAIVLLFTNIADLAKWLKIWIMGL